VAVAADGMTLLDWDRLAQGVPTEQEAEGDPRSAKLRDGGCSRRGVAPAEEVDRAIADPQEAFYKRAGGRRGAARAALTRSSAVSDERFGGDAPSFGPLRAALDEVAALRERARSRVKLQEDPDPVEARAAEAVARRRWAPDAPPAGWNADGSGAAPRGPARGRADERRRRDGARRRRRALPAPQDPTNPAPYLLLRGCAGASCAASGARRPAAARGSADGRARRSRGSCSTALGGAAGAGEQLMATPARARVARPAALRADRLRAARRPYAPWRPPSAASLRALLAAVRSCRR
jgi:hypothetical protein